MGEEIRETVEFQRLAASEAREADWKHWGPYVAERAWGTVREDYSPDGSAWTYFPHDHARSRAYRWNEDGIGGWCNRYQNICLGVALWNERDPILKERLFGLSGPEGNHGEDVKEHYFYLDGTPTHSYMKMAYRYPQVEYPYADLVRTNGARTKEEPEYELEDALREALAERRFFDVLIEYAKVGQEDFFCHITVTNHGPDEAPIHVIPQLWYRNVWSWGHPGTRGRCAAVDERTVHTRHKYLDERWWSVQGEGGRAPDALLFTENDTNHERLHGVPNELPYVKDAFHRAIVDGEAGATSPEPVGSKVGAPFRLLLAPGASATVSVRFADGAHADPFDVLDETLAARRADCDAFYAALLPADLDEESRAIQRAAYAGLLWTKQFFHYSVKLWLDGDPTEPKPPRSRLEGRNHDWRHLYALDVHAMPDKWEYPWFAAWDTAFHCLPLAMIDQEFAKRQLILLLREWYMHPNGQIPAYEWAFDDVNPPVHGWAAWRVYQISRDLTGFADVTFLKRIFHKLLLNFTWWVNRKDIDGNNVFQGGFLGLDNIGVFDRSAPLPVGSHIEQADGTAWMGMYSLNLLGISLELAREDPAYEDVATKFLEHFIYIADAINHLARTGGSLWDEEDGFFYDILDLGDDDSRVPLRVRSFVGLTPLFAVEVIEPEMLVQQDRFNARMEWFIEYRPKLVESVASLTKPGEKGRRLLALVNEEQLRRLLARVLDPDEFLSPYGLRSLSRAHGDEPYEFDMGDEHHVIGYEPAESRSELFGGNSNWRGPIWFPLNYLFIESLYKYHAYYGDGFKVEMPTGSGTMMTLAEVAAALSERLIALFRRGEDGRRPFNGAEALFHDDPLWADHFLFHEYFHGDTGEGLGASHQSGWTALVAMLLHEASRIRAEASTIARPDVVGEGETESQKSKG